MSLNLNLKNSIVLTLKDSAKPTFLQKNYPSELCRKICLQSEEFIINLYNTKNISKITEIYNFLTWKQATIFNSKIVLNNHIAESVNLKSVAIGVVVAIVIGIVVFMAKSYFKPGGGDSTLKVKDFSVEKVNHLESPLPPVEERVEEMVQVALNTRVVENQAVIERLTNNIAENQVTIQGLQNDIDENQVTIQRLQNDIAENLVRIARATQTSARYQEEIELLRTNINENYAVIQMLSNRIDGFVGIIARTGERLEIYHRILGRIVDNPEYELTANDILLMEQTRQMLDTVVRPLAEAFHSLPL